MKISCTPMSFMFLDSGDICRFTYGEILINQFIGTQKEGSVNNIYLRIYKNGEVALSKPLLGIHSGSEVYTNDHDAVIFKGYFAGITYTVTFYYAGDNIWLWNVDLSGNDCEADVIYTQDLGMGSMAGVQTNELYMSQYLGHEVACGSNGYTVFSRQNQTIGEVNPFVQQGMINGKAIGYSTDAMQFYGLSYKDSQIPQILNPIFDTDLPNRNYQFECSLIALQSEKVVFDNLSSAHSFTFYGLFEEHSPTAIRDFRYEQRVCKAYEKYKANLPLQKLKPMEPVKIKACYGEPYSSPEMSEAEISNHYPNMYLLEKADGKVMSFFTEDHAHVVTKHKELCVERPHGTIISSMPDENNISTNLLTTTNYIYGLFNAQTTIGNTSFHKLISTQRGLLNILKNHGQRIYVKLDGVYRMLNLPAVYEMGMNYSKWMYLIDDDILEITSYAVSDNPQVALEIKSVSGKGYDIIISTQLVMGDVEFTTSFNLEQKDNTLRITPAESQWIHDVYPGLAYEIKVEGTGIVVSDDRIFFESGQSYNTSLLTIAINQISKTRLIITGTLNGNISSRPVTDATFEEQKARYLNGYKGFNAAFEINMPNFPKEAAILNETVWWYTHNALVHFSAPHGLEQPGGAAWGTRDVCQGPFELLLTSQKYELLRNVLIRIFAHQRYHSGEWPQWFMYDLYTINAGECHGDVILWPLKCVGEYLEATSDFSILDEQVKYFTDDTNPPVESVLDHVKRAVTSLKKRFINDTGLITYAGGDWDDTLQPVDPEMKKQLVSSWTQALAFQVTEGLGSALQEFDPKYATELAELSKTIKLAFEQYLIKDNIIAGFVRRNNDGSLTYMLHPSDNETGIRYRLLPMTRSIISGLASAEQAQINKYTIHEKLLCPDGVRLMDRPAAYDGGISRLFVRAEQAANVGREISLQYTHAHIRYIEAMCKMGYAEEAWKGLFTINPIALTERLTNAMPRQSNMYFSSSDGDFYDRYEYERDFDKLFNGSINVKGGWRLYSSGPGIYLNIMIRDVLGLRATSDGIIFDPMLPASAADSRVTINLLGKNFTFVYRLAKTEDEVGVSVKGKCIATKPANDNPYRKGGLFVAKDELLGIDDEIEVSFFSRIYN